MSGGADSTTLLYDMYIKGVTLKALSFDYNQKHKKELKYAEATCKRLKIDHRIIDLISIISLINNSALTNPNMAIPEGNYQTENMKTTVVPNRNAIMLSIAVGYAENLKYDNVAIANHAGDHVVYPDCRPEFISSFNLTSQLGTYNKIQLYSPYTNLTKTDIFEIGLNIGIDYDKYTWSCYKGEEVACGKCGTCIERIEALIEATKRIKGV